MWLAAVIGSTVPSMGRTQDSHQEATAVAGAAHTSATSVVVKPIHVVPGVRPVQRAPGGRIGLLQQEPRVGAEEAAVRPRQAVDVPGPHWSLLLHDGVMVPIPTPATMHCPSTTVLNTLGLTTGRVGGGCCSTEYE